MRAIENLLQNKCAVIRAFLPIDAKKSSWAEKSAQLEKNMFPVREIFFPSWKPQIRGLYENMTFPAGNPYKSRVSDFLKIFDSLVFVVPFRPDSLTHILGVSIGMHFIP